MVETQSGKNVPVSATLGGPDKTDFTTPITITVADMLLGALLAALIGAAAHAVFSSIAKCF